MLSHTIKPNLPEFTIENLQNLKPKWFDNINTIKLPKQLSYIAPDISRETILVNVKLQSILKYLQEDFKKQFQIKELYKHGFYDEKTTNVITLWKQNKKLLPPHISYNEKTNKLIISDGRHRLNLSFCLNIEHLPIIVSFNDIETVIPLIEFK